MNYRMWVGEDDHGTADERPARLWLEYQREHYPEEPARLEEVADDAPIFLSRDQPT